MSRVPYILPLLFLIATGMPSAGGWIEEQGGETILNFKLHDWILPDPERTDTATRADAAVIRAFTDTFPEILKQKFRERYRAQPDRYGTYP